MDLHHELTLDIALQSPLFIGEGPYGNRVVASVDHGTVRGERVNGVTEGAGADWLLMGTDGFGRVDVRFQIRTDDDAAIYANYVGLIELNDVSLAALMDPSAETGWDDQYFRVAPVFEAGDERYRWMNQALFAARGRVTAPGIEYEVFRLT